MSTSIFQTFIVAIYNNTNSDFKPSINFEKQKILLIWQWDGFVFYLLTILSKL